MNLEHPKPPPVSKHNIEQLYTYYQELVSYHAQALEEAKRLLSHTEVLVQASHVFHVPPSASSALPSPSNPALSPSQSPAQLLDIYQGMSLLQAIQIVLASNPGEFLHVDYITRMLYGNEESNPQLNEKVALICNQGVEEGRWFEYPDSPLCFTITPMNLAPGSSQKAPAYPTPFPTAKLKTQYRNQTTIKGMVLAALETRGGDMNSQELIDELFEYFPEEDGREIRKTLAKAMQNACARGVLKRTDKGRYTFKGGRKRR